MNFPKFGLCGVTLVAAIIPTCASSTDWYIDGKSGNDGNAGTLQSPFLHVWRGLQFSKPGDILHLLPTAVYPSFNIVDTSGTSSAPITIVGDGVAPNLTKVRGDGSNFGIGLVSGAKNTPPSYLNIFNLDVSAPGPWSAIYVGTGSHHITISGNYAHDSGVSGISTTHADYVTISHNNVWGNSKYTATGLYGSGISTFENTDIDSGSGVKMIIDSNVVSKNTNTLGPFRALNPDGSGIILDDLRHSESDSNAYKGTTLIQNNIVFNNGGRGIDIYSSDHAIVLNNTAYHNNQDPIEGSWHPSEIMVNASGDAVLWNNLVSGDGGGAPGNPHYGISVEKGSGDPVRIDYEILYNATNNMSLEFDFGTTKGHENQNAVITGANNTWVDPLFVNPVKLMGFELDGGSLGLQSADPSKAPSIDLLGRSRPVGGPTEAGAFQQD